MAKLFLSYSHQDEEFRKQLETHLALLKRQGVIDIWHDRRIEAGQGIHNSIDQNIDDAEVILLLVSADFLASDYCYDMEMKRALERHESGVARVIPVILRPCDWHSAPFGNLRATPTDGKPVSKFSDRDDAYLLVVRDIRQAVEGIGNKTPSSLPAGQSVNLENITFERPNRSSNLRVQREPSDREKDKFLTESFEYISNYFENSLKELEARNTEVETEFRRIDANQFTAAMYRQGQITSQCRIWIGGMFSAQAISYSANRSGSANSFNESFSLNNDGYSLTFRSMLAFSQLPEQRQLSQEGVAEYFWSMLIEPLQRRH
jgi:TIR domain